MVLRLRMRFGYFETGKRRTWSGAKDAIIKANEAVPVKDEKRAVEAGAFGLAIEVTS